MGLLRPLTILDEARRETIPGNRLEAFRSAAPHLAEAIKASGTCQSVTTHVSFPYPAKFGLRASRASAQST